MNSTTTPCGGNVTREIVERIAENDEVDALEIAPLGSVIDPNLLDAFVGTNAVTAETTIRFEYEQHEVTVRGDGRVSITETLPRPKEDVG